MMDADNNLAEQREIIARVLSAEYDPEDAIDDATRLASLVKSLDNWVTGGGYLPRPWGKHWRAVRS